MVPFEYWTQIRRCMSMEIKVLWAMLDDAVNKSWFYLYAFYRESIANNDSEIKNSYLFLEISEYLERVLKRYNEIAGF